MDKWIEIDDSKVRHIWQDLDTGEEVSIFPAWYEENGTPLSNNGEDMVYLRTEILQ
jgi:hypothetical protein